MNKGIIILYEDFNDILCENILNLKIKRVGLHVNTNISTIDDFLCDVIKKRALIDKLEANGVEVDYRLHIINKLVKRELIEEDKTMFRQNEDGQRVQDHNICPSSKKALDLLEENAFNIAKLLNQKSNRYHFWIDDDMGRGVKCYCPKCKNISYIDQNIILYKAMLKGIRRLDKKATLSYLLYSGEVLNKKLPEGLFLEYAPFLRRHDLTIEGNIENEEVKNNIENIMSIQGKDTEVTEYFLSYDYSNFCKDGRRVKKDIEYYIKIGVKYLTTFVVFPQKDYILKYGNKGLKKYILL